jgi:hypothetical protein
MNLINTKANKPNEGQEYFSQFDNIYPYSEIGRWVVDRNTCQLLRALSHEDSNFTKMGQPIDLDTENEMIMVKYPAYYRKKNCRVNGVEQQGIALNIVPDKFGVNCPDGYTIEDWFLNEDGTIAEYRLLGAFNSYEDNGQMISIPNVIPTRSKNIQQFRDASKINRTESGIMSFYAISAVQRLFILEFGDFDSQKVLGKGKTYWVYADGADSEYEIIRSGNTMELGNRSGYLNRMYNEEELTDGKVSISYRGLEDFFGNIWQFIDGLAVMDNGYYYTNSLARMYQIKSNNVLNVDGWNFYETIVPTNNGYTSEMYGENLDFSFFSKEVNGGSSTYYSDYRYSYNGAGSMRVALLGGSWSDGAGAGAFGWFLFFSAASAFLNFGSRLESRQINK